MTTQNNRVIVRKVICFISDTAHPYLARTLPSELMKHVRPMICDIKAVCNEWYDKRGRFEKKVNLSSGNKQRQKLISQAELAGREIKKILAQLEKTGIKKNGAEVE